VNEVLLSEWVGTALRPGPLFCLAGLVER